MEPILFLEVPSDRKFNQWGSSMELLKKFLDFLDKEEDNISEIYLGMCLYNNGVLHEKMKALANRGIKVIVISIPLTGYRGGHINKIYKYGTNDIYRHNATKCSLAEEIYRDIEKLNSENYILRIFDHTYIERTSEENFSCYTRYAQFSLNTNSIYIKYKDGKTVTGLTSSNLAVGDKPIPAFMLLVKDMPTSCETTEKFFLNLLRYSVRPSNWQDPHPNYHYEMETVDDGNIEMNYFTAPFIWNSPIKIEEKIIDIISNAQERIYICAEELTAFDYRSINGERRSGILGAIVEKCRQSEKCRQRIEVKCLSRKYVNSHGAALRNGSPKPKYSDNFKRLIRQVGQLGSCSYSENKYVYAKFIVVDNIIIVGTGDYTPTQFLYGDVEVKGNFGYISYRGKYSDVNHYIIIEDGGLAEQLIDFFNEIIARPDTYVRGTTTVEKKYATGTWNGETVRFKKVWRGHTFTKDEIKQLLAGEEIVLMGIKGPYGLYNARGKLCRQTYKGNSFVGFERTGYVTDDGSYLKTANSEDYCVGTWRGREVRFCKTFRNHTFTDEECAKLLADEVIKFPATHKDGSEYTEKGKLENLERNGQKVVGFKSERF